MGKRTAFSRLEHETELKFIKTTALSGNLSNFNNDPQCFDNYIKMQAKFARRDGFPDIEREMLMANVKNWVGLPAHPTDQYIHWKDKDPKGRMLELRAAYDKLISLPDFDKNALEMLLEAAYDSGRYDERDSNAGEAL